MPHLTETEGMKILTTKRHIFKFYFILIFVFLMFSFMGSVLLYKAIKIFQEESIAPKEYFLPLAPILIFSFVFYTAYTYWKNSPKITIEIDRKLISFGTDTYNLKDIKELILTGKFPFRYIFKFPMEGAKLVFNNGATRYIYDDMYSNSWQIKKYLEEVIIEKRDYLETPSFKTINEILVIDDQNVFKGNPLTSLRGISLWGLIGFLIGFMIYKMKIPSMGIIITFSLVSIFWFILHSWLMHYFGLSNNYFVIMNHNYFWIKKIYRIEDIKEIVFESNGNQPNCLRIITKDYKNKLYPAGTLRDKTWLNMKDRLELKGVTVRNECIIN